MKIISKIYHNQLYILIVVILAIYSLFYEVWPWLDWTIYGLFISDLCTGSIIYFQSTEKKSFLNYLKTFAFDILACVPFAEFGIFKMFRLFRVARIVKIKKLNDGRFKINWENVFNFQTVKELAIWLSIYFIANIYIFGQIEGKDPLDSLYWLVETVTTVGYGDKVPTQPVSKILSIILMIIGVASIGYINGVITTTIVRKLNNRAE